MRSMMRQWVCVLALFQLLFPLALTTPNLGIRADHLVDTGKDIDTIIQSYSGIITFDDGTIPLDKTKMTDAKLLHLCVLAYNEMISIWRPRNLISSALPGGMAAIAYKDTIYFASTVRAPRKAIDLANVPKGSVRQLMKDNLEFGFGRSILASHWFIWTFSKVQRHLLGAPFYVLT